MKRLAIVFFACAGGQTTGTSSSTCLPIAPMRLAVLEHGREWEPQAELRPDGTIVREREVVVGRIVGNRLDDANGKPMATCTADKKLVVADGRTLAHFDANDRFVDADGSQLYVDDDGSVHWMRNGHDMFKNARMEGSFKSARRTAAMIVLATLAGGRWGF